MSRSVIVLAISCIFAVFMPATVLAGLLKDGFEFAGIEGSVSRSADSKTTWLFVPDNDLTDGSSVIEASTPIEILASGTLQKITADMDNDTSSIGIRLWAKVTRYKNRNFLFPSYFIPMSGIDHTPEGQAGQAAQAAVQAEPSSDDDKNTGTAGVEEPEDTSIIPEDVMAILKPKRTIDFTKVRQIPDLKGDSILSGRSGFVVGKDTQQVFEIDGFGRNVEGLTFTLLPCQALERAEQAMTNSPIRQRYLITGIMTKYNGRLYLLAQRVARTYAHGNFAR